MIRAYTEDGAKFEADSYEDLVSAMKMDMYVVPETKEKYMEGVAQRSKMYDGRKIQYSNAEEFIHELRRIGVITHLVEL